MKEATGELNMTVVVVVAIGILAAFFYTVIWPMISNNMDSKSKCNAAVCKSNTVDANGMADCALYDKNGNQKGSSFKCVWKG